MQNQHNHPLAIFFGFITNFIYGIINPPQNLEFNEIIKVFVLGFIGAFGGFLFKKITDKLTENKKTMLDFNNIFEHLKTTIVGVAFLIAAFFVRTEFLEYEPYVMFAFIGIGIVLLFCKDQLPNFIKIILNSLFK